MSVYRYPTPEWLAESARLYPEQPKFKKEFEKLSTKLCFRIKAEPAWSIDEDILFCAFVDKGELLRLSFISEEEAQAEAEFILDATPQEWKSLLRKEKKFVTEFMLGRIGLGQGSKVGVLSIAPHANTFVEALTQVELQFPDEMTPEELQQHRSDIQGFRQRLGV